MIYMYPLYENEILLTAVKIQAVVFWGMTL